MTKNERLSIPYRPGEDEYLPQKLRTAENFLSHLLHQTAEKRLYGPMSYYIANLSVVPDDVITSVVPYIDSKIGQGNRHTKKNRC